MNKYCEYDLDKIIKDKQLFSKIESASVLGTLLLAPNFAPISSIVAALYFYSLYQSQKINEGFYKNDEMITLYRIYNELLEEIIKISKELDNKELLEHYYLLNYIYKNRYLSYKRYIGEKCDLVEENKIMNLLCLNDHGVCRHTAAMNVDYLERLGYDAKSIHGLLYYDTEKTTKYVLNQLNVDNPSKEMLEYIKNGLKEKIKLKHYIFGNHAITMANDKDHTYYLDITQNEVYVPDKNILISPEGIAFSRRKIIEERKHLDEKEIYNLDYIENVKLNSETKINENIDIIKKFNKENEDMLLEAEKIYQKLRK